MSIVSDEPTTAPNGTEIIVPTKDGDGDAFVRAASAFFAYWPEDSVVVDGRSPERVTGLQLSDSVLLAPSYSGDSENIVVMGGVPYPFLDDVEVPSFGTSSERRRIVAFVDIGDVSFVPSREALAPSKRTREVLARIVAEVVALRDAAVLQSIADAPSPTAARNALREGRLLGFKLDAKYEGREIVQRYDREPRNADGSRNYASPDDSTDVSFLVHGGRYGKVTGERTWTLDLDSVLEGTDVFEGFESKSLSPTKRDKLSAWRESNGLETTRRAVFVRKLSASERYWLDGVQVHSFEDVDSVKLPKVVRADGTSGRPRGSYSVSTDGQYATDTPAENIDVTRPLYWTRGNAYSLREHPAVRSGAVDLSAASAVALPANRVDKFVRDFPTAVELNAAAQENADAWRAGVSADRLRAWTVQRSGDASVLRGLADVVSDIADAELRAAVVDATTDVGNLDAGLSRFRYWTTLEEVDRKSALRAYPLLVDRYGLPATLSGDMVLYVNAKYAASIGDAADTTSDRTSGKGDA